MGKEPKTSKKFAEDATRAHWNSAFRSMDFWAGKEARNIPGGMIELAKEARYFIHSYETFFDGVEDVLRPEDRDEYSKALILHRALGMALEEWDTIRHALEQRENTRYEKVLAELDALAVECLVPLFGRERMETGGVFTYLHKLFDIKRFAFSRTPLIGAPFDALNAPEAWLAIPHETGHYVFWNGTEDFDAFNRFHLALQDSVLHAIEAALQKRVTGGFFRRRGQVFQTWLNWIDEIFSDIFGTLIAGPAYAWSMQSNLRAQYSVRDLYHSHEEPDHPDPFIRPFFHIQTLREMARYSDGEMARRLADEANSLELSWKKGWFEKTGEEITDGQINLEIDRLPTPDSVGVMGDVLANEVPQVVSAILNSGLGDNLPNTLVEYFKAGVLYNQERHDRCKEYANQIINGSLLHVGSSLDKSIASQMAIVLGAEPVHVHQTLDYGGREDDPVQNDELDARFNEFITNVTGKSSPQDQIQAWRRVLGYSLMEQAFHWHTHPHIHG